MAENPYSSPKTSGPTPASQSRFAGKALVLTILKYVGAYVLGIVACILFTPTDMYLAGTAMWIWYLVAAPIGYLLFYLHLSPQQMFVGGPAYWIPFAIGLLPFLGEATAFFRATSGWRKWRPLWIGFPIGFVGTIGIYYGSAASI